MSGQRHARRWTGVLVALAVIAWTSPLRANLEAAANPVLNPNPPDERQRPTDNGRWPASTGLLVAGGGALLVGALSILRRRKPPRTR